MSSDPGPFPSGPREEVVWLKFCTKSLLNAARYGNVELVRQRLADGADPNACDKRGNAAIIRAVRGPIVEAAAVRALLDAGADPHATDVTGLTALDHARRRLLRYEGKPRRQPRRSPSLTEHGDVRLRPEENDFLDELCAAHPEDADEIVLMYTEERRKAAERVFDTRGNLEKIVEMLQAREP